MFREPMAARTDADGRKRGRVPAIGDWADGVHRGVARASFSKTEAQNAGPGAGGRAREWRRGGSQQKEFVKPDIK